MMAARARRAERDHAGIGAGNRAALRIILGIGSNRRVLTFDASDTVLRHRFWLTRDYLPEFAGHFQGADCRSAGEVSPVLHLEDFSGPEDFYSSRQENFTGPEKFTG
jgi:hypothetical protein